MSAVEDLEYYTHRALVERHRAKSAPSAVISYIHEQLAERYEELCAELQKRPSLRIVSSDQESSTG
jgi:hypothetical protein